MVLHEIDAPARGGVAVNGGIVACRYNALLALPGALGLATYGNPHNARRFRSHGRANPASLDQKNRQEVLGN